MGKDRVGRRHVKPLLIALLIVVVLIVVGAVIILINSPRVWYDYVYNFNVSEQGVNSVGFKVSLAKGEDMRGKLVVESGTAVLLVNERSNGKLTRVVDSGKIGEGGSFHFSIKSEMTYTEYDASFDFSESPNAIAKFYCSSNPEISQSNFNLWNYSKINPNPQEKVIIPPVKLK